MGVVLLHDVHIHIHIKKYLLALSEAYAYFSYLNVEFKALTYYNVIYLNACGGWVHTLVSSPVQNKDLMTQWF